MPEALHIVCPHCDTVNRVPRQRLGEGGKCGNCHRSLFVGQRLALNDPARFAKHAEQSDIPRLVDFWGTWCGPCRAMASIFEQGERQLEPAVRLGKVDTDESPEIASRFS